MHRSTLALVTHTLVSFTLLTGCALAQTPAGTTHSVSTVIRIESIPDSANVSVGGTMVGVTPVDLRATRGDTLALWLSALGFRNWTASYVPGAADTSHLLIRLERENPTISVLVEGSNTEVLLDGKRIAKGSIFDHMIVPGDHHLVVSDDSSGRSADIKVRFRDPQRYFFSAQLGTVRKERVFGAFLFPGSTHILDGEYVTGSLMLVGSVALGYAAFNEASDYSNYRGRYDLACRNYYQASTDAEATRLHQVVADSKSELDRAYTRKLVAFSLFIGGYLYSVIDGLLHHSIGDVLQVVPPRDIPGLPFPADAGRAQVRLTF
jgi:hypothetical protein